MRNNNIYNHDPKPKPTPKLQRRDANGFNIDKYLIRLGKFCEQEVQRAIDSVSLKMETMLVEEIGREWEEHIDRNAFLEDGGNNEEAKRLAKEINEEWIAACEDAAESFAVTFSREMSPKIAYLQM